MKLITVSQMREFENIAISDYKIPSILLMENAATGFVSSLKSEIGSLSGKRIHIFCGKGNNGGDGFAIARMMHNLNARVSLTALFDEKSAKGDAKTNLCVAKNMGIPFVSAENCADCDIIVDAIFGTGFHGETEGLEKKAIDIVNKSSAYIVSVDIPSGISADTGLAAASSVNADLCITFAAIKTGHLLFPGRSFFKKLIKTDISIPKDVINNLDSGYDVIDSSKKSLIPKRISNSHKGSFGKVLTFTGSRGMSGAAILSATAALKSGVGMVTASVPETIWKLCASQFKAVMTYPLPCLENDLKDSAADMILEKAKTQDVLLMGCGIGTSDATKNIVFRIINECEKPMVIDADGLNAISCSPEILLKRKSELVLTPHIAEFSRLTGLSVPEIKSNPIKHVRDFALKYNVTLVLKDAVTVIAEKAGNIYISTCSNSGMATAGSGDVLAGIIAALIAQGATHEDAAVSGVYIHLAAGLIARDEKGEYGMTAEDLLEAIPYAFTKEINLSPEIKEM